MAFVPRPFLRSTHRAAITRPVWTAALQSIRPWSESVDSRTLRYNSPCSSRSYSCVSSRSSSRSPSLRASAVKQIRYHSDRAAASQTAKQGPRTANQGVIKSSSKPAPELVTDDASKVSDKQQSLTDWKIIKRLASNIWPKGQWEVKTRVVGALGLLVAGKVCYLPSMGMAIWLTVQTTMYQILNVQVPFFFKDIVDALNVEVTADSTVWVLGGAAISGCT
jgi:ATP-binding cassette subfamily B (MDR/TAP) protein 7